MNSVHEPGSRTMSKNRLRNNTKSTRIENRPRAPSAQPVASLRAQRLGRTHPALPARLLPLAPAARPACRACQRLLPAACAPLLPARLSAPPGRPAQRPAARLLMSQDNLLYRDTSPANPVHCNTLPAFQASLSAIQWLYCNTKFFPNQPALPAFESRYTWVLQYNPCQPAAIHFPSLSNLQYIYCIAIQNPFFV